MFTGLIEELGQVVKITRGAASARLVIRAGRVLEGTTLGDSIAVNGVCLTVVEKGRETFVAEVMAETLARTNLAYMVNGDPVNLERALQMGDRFGGHLVSGHVDGMGEISRLAREDIATLMTVKASPDILRYLLPKGSIALDGVSLTVVSASDEGFTVSLIPHTLTNTTLKTKKVGGRVNLEIDMLAKYVERLVRPLLTSVADGGGGQRLRRLLTENGFI